MRHALADRLVLARKLLSWEWSEGAGSSVVCSHEQPGSVWEDAGEQVRSEEQVV
jgi:hypothetical protein